MRFLKVEVFSILVDRVCKVKYDSLKVCSKMFRHFVGGSSYLRILRRLPTVLVYIKDLN